MDTEILNPLGLLGSVFCLNEVTLGGLLNSFKTGAGHQKDQIMIRSSEVPALFLTPSVEGREAGD